MNAARSEDDGGRLRFAVAEGLQEEPQQGLDAKWRDSSKGRSPSAPSDCPDRMWDSVPN
ncbi:hypothetical protein [Edaphobacter modestus]|uniref:hypothetical protein n=1 Tax=Edaphobacter modestus TaxID=388466 RepID=UPI0013EED0B6|nr:hypothetical protein [Edaphobacter modestus]